MGVVDRVLLLVVLGGLGTLGWLVSATVREPVVRQGDAAPAFQLAGEGGRTAALAANGLTLVNFWASWCPPCLEEWPSLEAAARLLEREGVSVVALSVDRDEKAYQNFLASRKPPFVVARDQDAALSWKYGVFKYPETFLVKDGRVVQKWIGAIEWTDPAVLAAIRRHK